VAATALLAVAGLAVRGIRRKRGRDYSSTSAQKADIKSLDFTLEGGMGADVDPASWILKPSDVEAVLDVDGAPVFLGQGAFGVVTQAKLFGVHDVAVKTISRSETEVPYSAFLREVSVLHHVSRNRNVVQFYGACQERDSLMIVTELMDGGDLRRALSGEGAAELAWAQRGKEVALDIVRGLCFLHSCKVIHRDMKSKNVLLSKQGPAKICDVGMAVIHTASVSMNAGFNGTFAWAAPELLLGQRCDSKVDIFSMGVILWEIATGKMPQRGAVFPPEPGPRCPKQLAAIMARCLHVEPSKRPTARQLFDLLAACPQQ
jgi:serine/threonine protein kinase